MVEQRPKRLEISIRPEGTEEIPGKVEKTWRPVGEGLERFTCEALEIPNLRLWTNRFRRSPQRVLALSVLRLNDSSNNNGGGGGS
jgi:hypothetical protein